MQGWRHTKPLRNISLRRKKALYSIRPLMGCILTLEKKTELSVRPLDIFKFDSYHKLSSFVFNHHFLNHVFFPLRSFFANNFFRNKDFYDLALTWFFILFVCFTFCWPHGWNFLKISLQLLSNLLHQMFDLWWVCGKQYFFSNMQALSPAKFSLSWAIRLCWNFLVKSPWGRLPPAPPSHYPPPQNVWSVDGEGGGSSGSPHHLSRFQRRDPLKGLWGGSKEKLCISLIVSKVPKCCSVSECLFFFAKSESIFFLSSDNTVRLDSRLWKYKSSCGRAPANEKYKYWTSIFFSMRRGSGEGACRRAEAISRWLDSSPIRPMHMKWFFSDWFTAACLFAVFSSNCDPFFSSPRCHVSACFPRAGLGNKNTTALLLRLFCEWHVFFSWGFDLILVPLVFCCCKKPSKNTSCMVSLKLNISRKIETAFDLSQQKIEVHLPALLTTQNQQTTPVNPVLWSLSFFNEIYGWLKSKIAYLAPLPDQAHHWTISFFKIAKHLLLSVIESTNQMFTTHSQATIPWTTIATLGCGYKLLHFATPMKIFPVVTIFLLIAFLTLQLTLWVYSFFELDCLQVIDPTTLPPNPGPYNCLTLTTGLIECILF